MYYWRMVKGLTPRVANIHVVFGGAFSKAIESARIAYYVNGATATDAMYEGIRTGLKAWDPDCVENTTKHPVSLVTAITGYFNRWPLDNTTFQPISNRAVEHTFAIPIRDFAYTGRIDMLYNVDGRECVVDEKTTARLGPSWYAQWERNGQFFGYAYARKQITGEYPFIQIRGVALRQDGSVECVEVMPRIWEHEVNVWMDSVCATVSNIRRCMATDSWPQHVIYGTCAGISQCPYFLLCKSGEVDKLTMGATYIHSPWDPLKMREVNNE